MPYIPKESREKLDPLIEALAQRIAYEVSNRKSNGEFAGELNYCLTRLLQELPKKLVGRGVLSEELTYWTQPLMYGILLDVALEHKLRVNMAYEAEKIIENGDCFDTPYKSELTEVKNAAGNCIGHYHLLKGKDE